MLEKKELIAEPLADEAVAELLVLLERLLIEDPDRALATQANLTANDLAAG
ncbi:hypothetical protein [Gayadomonas joobiniege]|uniref:hypothetical protein n=1 Tax=Gayadomonas joobiniege TaxID=1234606 RepID=UPI000373C4D3|nr:hypothetical protein [Gayadomonas joobiniege]